MPTARLLVVDDEEHVTAIIEEYFTSLGYEVEIAHDGAEALRRAAAVRPDVVLLDINMPRMNGVEVLRDIKQIDETIAVIMVTANEQVQLAADALKSGAFGYVPKPFDFRYLDHMLATIFDKPRVRK
jgi:DNA-binding response OmpR family regulator